QAVLIRYLADGALDPTFGTGGIAHAQMPDLAIGAERSLLLPDGKILVVATGGEDSVHSSTGFVLTRFLPSGQLDTSFGSGGSVFVDLHASTWLADVALGPSGSLVIGARAIRNGVSGGLVARLTPAGGLDAAFGSGGFVFFG